MTQHRQGHQPLDRHSQTWLRGPASGTLTVSLSLSLCLCLSLSVCLSLSHSLSLSPPPPLSLSPTLSLPPLSLSLHSLFLCSLFPPPFHDSFNPSLLLFVLLTSLLTLMTQHGSTTPAPGPPRTPAPRQTQSHLVTRPR